MMHPHDAIHQLAVGRLARVLHPFGLGEIQGQWLFAEDVFPEVCGTTCPFAMERRGQGNIDGVDVGLAQQFEVTAEAGDWLAGGKEGEFRIGGGVPDRALVDPVSGAGFVAAGNGCELSTPGLVNGTPDFRRDAGSPQDSPADGTCRSGGAHLWYVPMSSP